MNTNNTIETLADRIGGVYTKALVAGEREHNGYVLRSRWRIGRMLASSRSNLQCSREFGPRWWSRLSQALGQRLGPGFGDTNLRAMRSFYLAYKEEEIRDIFSWRHYKAFLSIGDPERRRSWERRVAREGIAAEALEQMLRGGGELAANRPVTLSRQNLDYYEATVREKEFGGLKYRGLDAGFRRFFAPPGLDLSGFAPGTVVRLTVESGAFCVEPVEREQPSYLYLARVQRVIDGDTLQAEMDFGGGSFQTVELRLRKVYMPELNMPRGHAAAEYVQERLHAGDLIAVRSYQADKYRRYVADVIYSEEAKDRYELLRNGRWLNEELRRWAVNGIETGSQLAIGGGRRAG